MVGERSNPNLKRGRILEVTVVRIAEEYIFVTNEVSKFDGQIAVSEFNDKELKALKVGTTLKAMVYGRGSGSMVLFSKKEAEKIENWTLARDAYRNKLSVIVELSEFGKCDIEEFKTGKTVTEEGYLGRYIDFDVFIPEREISREHTGKKDVKGLQIPVKIIGLRERKKLIIASERLYIHGERAKKMNELLTHLDIGVVLEGKVVRISQKDKFFIVDLEGLNGKLKFENVSWDRYQNPLELIKIGNVLKVVVIDFDKESKEIWLSIKDLSDDPWERVDEYFKPGDPVGGAVYRIFDFGVVIELNENFRALIPNQELTFTRLNKNPATTIKKGDHLSGVIKNIDKENRKILVSIRDEILKKYNIGDTVKGRVVKVEKYGAFIEIEKGFTGLLKVEDISWSNKKQDAASLLEPDMEITVKILSIDNEKRQVDFGLKQIEPDPWDTISSRYPEGAKVKGTVVKVIEAGAFIMLDDYVDAFLHLSKIPVSEGGDWKEKVALDSEIEATVIYVNTRDRKIQISMLDEKIDTDTKRRREIPQTEYVEEKEESVTLGDNFSPGLLEELKKKAEEREKDKKEE